MRLGVRHLPVRAGHYSEDRTRWYDESTHAWYPLTGEQEHLEIVLEDFGGSSWLASLWTTVGTQLGGATMRFVGRVQPRHGSSPDVQGTTFSRVRSIPDGVPPQEAWAPGMTRSLEELRETLLRQGWLPVGRGDHPWSYRYVRPVVDWTRPAG